MANKKIIWDKQPVRQLTEAVEYIARYSTFNAENVKNTILQKIETLSKNPAFYPPDKYKLNNDGNYRALEVHHYRIAYYEGKSEIRILRVRHTSMEPLMY